MESRKRSTVGSAKQVSPTADVQRLKVVKQPLAVKSYLLRGLLLCGIGGLSAFVFSYNPLSSFSTSLTSSLANKSASIPPITNGNPAPAWLQEGPYAALPTKKQQETLKIQQDLEKQEEIKAAFKESWAGYETHAWGSDEFHPISKSGSNLTKAGGVGYTIVDALDSLLVMDLREEYERARDWVRTELTFDRDGNYNTFETTIRLLGGLLSAYHLSLLDPEYSLTDPDMYLHHAVDIADRLMAAFDSPTGLPWSLVNLGKRQGIPDKDNNKWASLAEVGTLGLEFKYLSHLTGDMTYWRKVEMVSAILNKETTVEGIASIFISPETGKFMMSDIRLGSRGDSYYEYLIKEYLQTDRREPIYRDMYDRSMSGIKRHLMARSPREKIIHTQELLPRRTRDNQVSWQITPKQDHLVCFLGGSFLLGLTEGGRKPIDWEKLSREEWEDYQAGVGIIESCMATHDTATGLAPEIAMFWQASELKGQERDWYIKSAPQGRSLLDARNILRPETVESLFLAYRLTGDEKYRQYGWSIFKAFQKHCRLPGGGYAAIENVDHLPVKREDKMETFWLSETLKYLYLLFGSHDQVDLRINVFNTEAHILPVFTPLRTQLTTFSQG